MCGGSKVDQDIVASRCSEMERWKILLLHLINSESCCYCCAICAWSIVNRDNRG